jgi:hypothetical protein
VLKERAAMAQMQMQMQMQMAQAQQGGQPQSAQGNQQQLTNGAPVTDNFQPAGSQ